MIGKGKISQLSDRRKQILTFSACIFLAAVIWVVNALNKSYTVRLNVPIKSASSVSALSPVAEKVEIEIKGKGLILFRFISDLKSFSLDLSAGSTTRLDSFVDTRRGIASLLHSYENSLELVRIHPEKLPLQRSTLYSRKLPVKMQLELTENKEYIASGPAVVYPDSIWIFSTRPFSEKLKYLETEKFNAKISDKSVFRSVGIIIPEAGIYAETERVWIYQPIEKSTEIQLRVNIMHSHTSTCIPAKAELKCRIPVSKFASTQAHQFTLIAGNPDDGTGLSIIKLRNAPYWCRQIHFQPMSVHSFQINGETE